MAKLFLSLLILLGFITSCFWSSSPNQFTVYRSNLIEGIYQQGIEKNIQGFTDDLFFEIARRKKIRIKINTIENAKEATLIDMPGADAAVVTVVPGTKNLKVYRFSDPFFAFGPVIVLRIDEPYRGLADLKDKVVGYDRAYASQLEGRNDIQFFSQPYDQVTTAMEDLLNEKLDAVVLDSILAFQYARSFYHGKIKVVTPPLKETDLRLVAKIGKNDKLIKLFNEGLQEIKDQGLYDKMLEYWSLMNP